MIGGFMAGVALGQKLVGMNKSSKPRVQTKAQRLQSAKFAAYKRMQARQKQLIMNETLPVSTYENSFSRPRRGNGQNSMGAGRNFSNNATTEEIVFSEGFTKEFRNTFKDDASGQLLNSIRNSFAEFNNWVKQQTNGLLDLNMSLAIFFIIRGIRRIILEKQYPNAWQMIWWASSILRGWRFV